MYPEVQTKNPRKIAMNPKRALCLEIYKWIFSNKNPQNAF
jgi:hypothetical protein